ncbi:class I SAM-dependent DNA methyltransferase [Acidocella sp.]|uniref:HsdM family class I SAM-dependent methyltransferase n=1 Tax=Acidocella sp. TaxID=50710 RepID=UPI00262F05BE|nr:N-6 DNA methylase [Acidocella sp.]
MAGLLKRISERRSEHLLNDLLVSQGWVLRRPPHGDVLFQNEYRSIPDLADALSKASKSGLGFGIPEAILVDRETQAPLAVIEVKPLVGEIDKATVEAQAYAEAFWKAGSRPLAIGLAGTSDDEFRLQVSKRVNSKWVPVTYDGYPISWIPTRIDLDRVAVPRGPAEIRPTMPPLDVLAARADEINRLLRESQIRDGLRPVVVGAIMLALWNSKGEIRRDPRYILRDINESCRDAFVRAGKADLAKSLRVDEANEKLRDKSRRITTILERLNVTVLTAEHDYLGQLYETFFRYTGGNTIGQYFTPRHITKMMADVCGVTQKDVVIDPACGTGGFLIACMDRLLKEDHLSRSQMVEVIKSKLIGFEAEPETAALCVANMILRGDGSTGIHRADCLSSPSYPLGLASVALMNPPFPHQKTDTPSEEFVDRALEALRDRGKLAVILPTGLLAKPGAGEWRAKILRHNTLVAVCQLPNELFQPFAAATTSFVVIEKGVPHNPKRKTTFVRLHYDGLELQKGARVERGSNQIPEAIEAILNGTVKPGFSGTASIAGAVEWSAGAYIPSAPPEEAELREAVDVLLRRMASFYTRYAPEVLNQRRAIEAGEIVQQPYREIVSNKKLDNAATISGNKDDVGGRFDMFYGLGALESREGIPPGRTLIISPTEQYNGCDGWLEFDTVLEPPFITVARTGSIGEAFVHLEPCAPNSDCIVLLPRRAEWSTISELIMAASAIRLEKWRYNYGRKITPQRLAGVKLSHSPDILAFAANLYGKFEEVIAASLSPYQTEDERDASIAKRRLTELSRNPERWLRGSALNKRLLKLEEQ